MCLQVWNVNKYSGVVGVFNIQGSTWSRTRRQFIIHDQTPPQLSTTVKPADIPLFSTSLSQQSANSITSDSNGHGSQSSSCAPATAEFAVYNNASDELHVMGLHEAVPVTLAGEL